MNNRYLITGMRSILGALIACDPSKAEMWDVVERSTGRTVARCETEVDARAAAAGLWAMGELEARAAEAERCRVACCAALGVSCDTLAAAVAALLDDHADVMVRLLEQLDITAELVADNDSSLERAA